jgi:hypothetical protein
MGAFKTIWINRRFVCHCGINYSWAALAQQKGIRMSRLIRRIDGKTGIVEWHTLDEWNIINGYEKPKEIVPFIEVVDGEVVNFTPKTSAISRVAAIHSITEARSRYLARRKRRKSMPKSAKYKEEDTRPISDNGMSNPTMFEPC